MLAPHLFAAGSSGIEAPLPLNYSIFYNGQSGGGNPVQIGLASTTDGGINWRRSGSNPIIPAGIAGTWNSTQTHAPCVLWDGTQWVLYADGYDGSNYRIGRWTSPDLVTWTPNAGNPIVGLGAGGAFDDVNAQSPQVTYDATLSPPWKMWYVGNDGAVITVGFADSADGITWTKRGKVIGVGTAGQFHDEGVGLGCAIRVGSTWYVFIAGQADSVNPVNYRSGYTTVAVGSEGTAAAYATPVVISALSGTLTLDDYPFAYRHNALIAVVRRGTSYVGYGTAFNPTNGVFREVTFRATSPDLITWTVSPHPVLPLSNGGAWETISAENPSVVANR
ncbi:MAG: hypothetical protein EPN91_00760 [Salinibacterium sp.]|nr:MAG: hypothetical protein EPN91_00760 [Salinibacterium sp.]